MEKIQFTINAWKSKLLDLTKRNKALSFKPNPVSTVEIVDELAAEIFRLLYLQRKALKFKAAPERKKEHSDSPDDPTSSESDERDENFFPRDYQPYDKSSIAARHTDDYLQTASTPEKLDKSLRRLEQQARLSIEEQGVNSLFLTLGMLHYQEREDSTELYRAPLILVPVELARSSARIGYTVRKTDDEVVVNPSLGEYLRRTHNISLADLPDSETIADGYDLQTYFAAVKKAIKNKTGWMIKEEMNLALFSFQKLVIYKDLEKNSKALASNSILERIITRSGEEDSGLPADIRDLDLDEEFPPELSHQVVDADSSQLRAIAAVSRDHSLVLEGPPGTGKSQTITNLIAQALSLGKSVLFVAEKMAALDVVHRRLVDVGLGEFCLELHSSKANKRAVMHEIGNTLNASLQRAVASPVGRDRLPQVRGVLSDYARAVHTEFGALNKTLYRAVGELATVIEAPKVALNNDISSYTQEQIATALRDAQDLAVIADALEVPPSGHPWREMSRTFYSEQTLDNIQAMCAELDPALTEAQILAQSVEATYGLPPIQKLSDIGTVLAISAIMAESPGAPIQVLNNPEWNTPPAEATMLIASGRKLNGLREHLLESFVPEVLEYDPRDDIAYIEHKLSGFFRFLAFLDSRYRSIKKRWLLYRTPNYQGTLLDQAADFQVAVEMLKEKKVFRDIETRGPLLFGALWQGVDSDWDALEGYVKWVLDFRRLFVEHGLRENAAAAASHAAPDLAPVTVLEDRFRNVRDLLEKLAGETACSPDYFFAMDLPAMRSRVDELAQNLPLAPRWAQFELARQKLANGVAAELLPIAISGDISFFDIAPAYKRAFYQQWISKVVEDRPALQSFHTLSHEERIREFRKLDADVINENRSILVGELRSRLQDGLRRPEIQNGMRFLRGQLAKQRNLAPLRTTIRHSIAAIRAIKPCFMMSPLTVSQLLDDEAEKFDLVIFDEASQLPTEDAVCSIMRAKQLVVVGDPKQLPPTNFFAVQSGQVNTIEGEDGMPLYEDTQSILEEVMGAGVAKSRLKWHYRSAHESLITFSNVKFYDSELYTFPSVEIDSPDTGLKYDFVANGVYEGKGVNHIEARVVADAVVEHFKSNPQLSLGVGTFNSAQQSAIQDELESRRRNDPDLEPFFQRGQLEPFFVKNLENIQGDERDVIFLSVTYGRSGDGKLRYNLGPLNGENGWRRLNVLTTRARRLMRVFSSMRSVDINVNETASLGARLLKEFLGYAEGRNLNVPAPAESIKGSSPFEEEVAAEMRRRGYSIIREVGLCGYRIDMGVTNPEGTGRFVCGIECDGWAYYSSETARDRDRLRHQVLEAQGWDIHRVWSADWYKDRLGQIDRLAALIETSKRKREPFPGNPPTNGVPPLAPGPAQEGREPLVNPPAQEYMRPVGAAYQIAMPKTIVRRNLLDATGQAVCNALVRVVEMEGPLHFKDLASRVAGMWGQTTGSQIVARIQMWVRNLADSGQLAVRGDFVWRSDSHFVVRSRKGTGIPAERIAPEEVGEAILMVLRAGDEFTPEELLKEVRAVFGFSRTGSGLQQVITGEIGKLLSNGVIGEGRIGIAIRQGA